eukprot:scaffold206634_cov35-Tisochrysis_lutea.AAC.1
MGSALGHVPSGQRKSLLIDSSSLVVSDHRVCLAIVSRASKMCDKREHSPKWVEDSSASLQKRH